MWHCVVGRSRNKQCKHSMRSCRKTQPTAPEVLKRLMYVIYGVFKERKRKTATLRMCTTPHTNTQTHSFCAKMQPRQFLHMNTLSHGPCASHCVRVLQEPTQNVLQEPTQSWTCVTKSRTHTNAHRHPLTHTGPHCNEISCRLLHAGPGEGPSGRSSILFTPGPAASAWHPLLVPAAAPPAPIPSALALRPWPASVSGPQGQGQMLRRVVWCLVDISMPCSLGADRSLGGCGIVGERLLI